MILLYSIQHHFPTGIWRKNVLQESGAGFLRDRFDGSSERVGDRETRCLPHACEDSQDFDSVSSYVRLQKWRLQASNAACFVFLVHRQQSAGATAELPARPYSSPPRVPAVESP